MILYLIWSLLPLTFFMFAIWAIVKPLFGVNGKESAKEYAMQGAFCALALAIAVAIDRAEWFESLIAWASFEMLDFAVARWLLYPGILLGLAYLQRIIKGEKRERKLPSRFIYN